MLKDIDLPNSCEYRTGSKNEPLQFFLEALPHSKQFDLLLGYFSSSAINILSLGFATFIYNGGKVRMIINEILSSKDKETLIKGANVSESYFGYSVLDFKKIMSSLDEYGTHFFNCLAWLIASKRLEIRVIKPASSSKGISHFKSGQFEDGQEKIKFKSSCNFTASGLLENLEELEIKPSWLGEANIHAISEYESYFEKVFDDRADFVTHLPFEDIEEAILDEFGDKSINELLVTELELLRKRKDLETKAEIQKSIEKLEQRAKAILTEPRFPFPEPRAYQKQAYENWVNNDRKGVFAMATGTGKTITALNCVLNEYKENGNYRSLILAPTIELVAQWKLEIEKFNFKNVVLVSSHNRHWRTDLKRITTLAKNAPNYSFFIVSTYRSFTSARFQQAFQLLPNDTVLIADEAHNCGSPQVLKKLDNFPLELRIGLSATPERVYDDEGTESVNRFFNDTHPYTFEFSMKEALDKGYLCQYYYHPILVPLTEDELKKYVEISHKLSSLYNSDDPDVSELAEKLLLLRKQIIHKASLKVAQFDELVSALKKSGRLKHTLVYAPEGYFDETQLDDIETRELDIEENRICEFYSHRIRFISPETRVSLFHADTTNRNFILEEFSKSTIDVLVSMKCLDEGVDVPRTQTAIFCASTGNPRQFIQRRGRILRTHPEKDFAHIYDLVVVPSTSRIVGDPNVERNLIKNELKRVDEFAQLALNKHQALRAIEPVTSVYHIEEIY